MQGIYIMHICMMHLTGSEACRLAASQRPSDIIDQRGCCLKRCCLPAPRRTNKLAKQRDEECFTGERLVVVEQCLRVDCHGCECSAHRAYVKRCTRKVAGTKYGDNVTVRIWIVYQQSFSVLIPFVQPRTMNYTCHTCHVFVVKDDN